MLACLGHHLCVYVCVCVCLEGGGGIILHRLQGFHKLTDFHGRKFSTFYFDKVFLLESVVLVGVKPLKTVGHLIFSGESG